MQISPGTRCGRIALRLALLGQAGDDAEGHLGADAAAVEDGLVEGFADGFAQGGNDFGQQVDVAVLDIGVADGEETADFVAVELKTVEAERQLVELGAAVGPDGLRDASHDDLAAVAADGDDVNVLQQHAALGGGLTDQA